MGKNSDTSNEHIRLITAMVNKLMSEGYNVSADHIGYPNGLPDKVNNFIPDIYAYKGDKKIIVEAKTCKSLEDEQTKVELVALSTNKDIEFSLIVPKRCVERAKELTKKWGVKVKNFWKLDI